MLIPYHNPQELADGLYEIFLSQMQSRNISADTGSGLDVLPLISLSITEAINKGELPPSSAELATFPEAANYLQQAEINTKRLADMLADDAVAANVTTLHEWSLTNVKRRLCPLYPFFREPCSQYDHLT